GAAVDAGVHVELDEVGAELDGALERGEGVLGMLRRGSAVRDDDHLASRRRIKSTSIVSEISSASPRRLGARVAVPAPPPPPPAALAEAIPASVSSNTRTSAGSTP